MAKKLTDLGAKLVQEKKPSRAISVIPTQAWPDLGFDFAEDAQALVKSHHAVEVIPNIIYLNQLSFLTRFIRILVGLGEQAEFAKPAEVDRKADMEGCEVYKDDKQVLSRSLYINPSSMIPLQYLIN